MGKAGDGKEDGTQALSADGASGVVAGVCTALSQQKEQTSALGLNSLLLPLLLPLEVSEQTQSGLESSTTWNEPEYLSPKNSNGPSGVNIAMCLRIT